MWLRTVRRAGKCRALMRLGSYWLRQARMERQARRVRKDQQEQ